MTRGAGEEWTRARESRNRIEILLKATDDFAFFFDFDGTLVEDCCAPTDVVVPDGLADLIDMLRIANRGAVALLSARTLVNLDDLLRPLQLPGCGQHGVERRYTEGGPALVHSAADLDPVRAYLAAQGSLPDGLSIMDRGFTIAIACVDGPRWSALARFIAEEVLRALPDSYDVKPGRLATEITPKGESKASTLLRLMETPPFKDRLPIVFGNDEDDDGAFLAAQSMGGIAFQVGPRRGHRADIELNGPTDVHWLIREFSLRAAAGRPRAPALRPRRLRAASFAGLDAGSGRGAPALGSLARK